MKLYDKIYVYGNIYFIEYIILIRVLKNTVVSKNKEHLLKKRQHPQLFDSKASFLN